MGSGQQPRKKAAQQKLGPDAVSEPTAGHAARGTPTARNLTVFSTPNLATPLALAGSKAHNMAKGEPVYNEGPKLGESWNGKGCTRDSHIRNKMHQQTAPVLPNHGNEGGTYVHSKNGGLASTHPRAVILGVGSRTERVARCN